MRPYVGYGCRDDADMILQPSRDRTWQQSIIQHVKCHNVQNEHISLETQRRKGLSQFGWIWVDVSEKMKFKLNFEGQIRVHK